MSFFKKIPKNKRRKDHLQLSPAEKRCVFSEAIESVKYLVKYSTSDVERVAALEYATEVFGRSLAYDVALRPLIGIDEEPQNRYTIPVPPGTPHMKQNCSLAGVNIVSVTGKDKLIKAPAHVFANGFLQINNYTGTYYPDINLVVVENGRHHLSSAYIKGTGSVALQIFRLKDFFPYLKTDGAFWYMNNERSEPVEDCRVAILYEIERLRQEMDLPKQLNDLKEREFVPPERKNPLDYLSEIRRRNLWLELELQIKNYKIQRMKGAYSEEEAEKELEQLNEKVAALKATIEDRFC